MRTIAIQSYTKVVSQMLHRDCILSTSKNEHSVSYSIYPSHNPFTVKKQITKYFSCIYVLAYKVSGISEEVIPDLSSAEFFPQNK